MGNDSNSLKARVVQGGGVLLIADVYSSALRLGGNLLMTRLLFPEAFGLMLVLNLVFTALEMMFDLGVRSALISKEGVVGQSYLNTAWTLQILRGAALAMVALILAVPIADYYRQPELSSMIALASLAPLISGFCSPYPMLKEKSLQIIRVVVWKGLVQTLSLGVLLGWLLIYPTIWALVANGVVAALITVGTSFYLFQTPRLHLMLERDSVVQIVNVGKWVMLASALAFLARQGDALIMSKWVTVELLGVFSIALGFAGLVESLTGRLGLSLLFPLYSELRADLGFRFNARLRKIKIAMYGLCAPPLLFFAVFGREFIGVLYDPRYHGAGWMLEIMTAGGIFSAAGAAVLNLPMSFGDFYRQMQLQLARFLLLLSAMFIGGWYGGLVGLVAGIAVAQALLYPLVVLTARRYGVKDIGVDVLFLGFMIFFVAIAWSIRGWPGAV